MRRWLAGALLVAGIATPLVAQIATADRVSGKDWWPTTRTTSRADYIGAAECVRCHPSQARQQTTSMAKTAWRAGESPALPAGERLQFQLGHYTYAIEKDGDRVAYSVSGGGASRSAPLAWAIGAGNVGQTFLFDLDGRLHEARVSYYHTVRRLGFTPNRALTSPRDLTEAMARPVDEPEARRCFGCHTTASSTREGFDLSRLTPGVTCEACHGPGRAHREAAERGGPEKAGGTILNPSTLSAADSVDFCGACHATFWDVRLANERGLAALRSQPFRLQSSRCWQRPDDRLTCVACHDPHKPLVRGAAAYDRNCLACHAGGGATPAANQPIRACPVGTEGCAGCHMPKYDVPEMHFSFTDHRIRIDSAKLGRR